LIIKDPYFLSSGDLAASLTTAPKETNVKVARAVRAKTAVIIDGNLSDFADAKPLILDKQLDLKEGTNWSGPKDLSGAIFLKWDENYVYVAAKVNDLNSPVNIRRRGDIWNGDAIELTISTDPGADPKRGEVSENDFQIGFGTGDGKLNKPSVWIWQKRTQPEGSVIFVKKTATGYNLEAKVPWGSFTNYRPRDKDTVGFDIALDDADKAEREAQLIWNGDYAFYRDPSVWGRLQFIEQ